MKPRIPQRISAKAEGFYAPTGRAKETQPDVPTQAFNAASGPLLAIAVKDNGNSWEVMSHERYNNQIRI